MCTGNRLSTHFKESSELGDQYIRRILPFKNARAYIVKIHYIGVGIPKRTLKKWRFGDFGEKYTFDRKTNDTSVFISSMAMIFIFGFATKDAKGKKYEQSEICVPKKTAKMSEFLGFS